jgi:hypothetical protein
MRPGAWSAPTLGEHISALTNSLSNNGTITHQPIFIRVTMANCPTLTLTDLPGITSISPNQDDIEEATVVGLHKLNPVYP